MNRDITILQDYSAGSNATTMLCMDKQSTFYRKYAFGKDGAKLAEQLDWLRAQQRPPAAVRYSAQRRGRRLLLV